MCALISLQLKTRAWFLRVFIVGNICLYILALQFFLKNTCIIYSHAFVLYIGLGICMYISSMYVYVYINAKKIS